MMRIFLSFASEDSAVAKQFAEFWNRLGVAVFRFDDPQRQAGRVVEEIERQIANAGMFVVLMSPHYLNSSWCRQERDLAIQHENDTHRPFVRVIKVAETVHAESGLLSTYHWLDAIGELTGPRLNGLALGGQQGAVGSEAVDL